MLFTWNYNNIETTFPVEKSTRVLEGICLKDLKEWTKKNVDLGVGMEIKSSALSAMLI